MFDNAAHWRLNPLRAIGRKERNRCSKANIKRDRGGGGCAPPAGREEDVSAMRWVTPTKRSPTPFVPTWPSNLTPAAALCLQLVKVSWRLKSSWTPPPAKDTIHKHQVSCLFMGDGLNSPDRDGRLWLMRSLCCTRPLATVISQHVNWNCVFVWKRQANFTAMWR